MNKYLTILHLYPHEMNLYGDHGNILVLKRRLEWRGYEAKVVQYGPGDNQSIIDRADIIFGGGGQDSGQAGIEDDLRAISTRIKSKIKSGTPTLVVCGMYQLFGNFFRTIEGDAIDGISVFDLETVGGKDRLTGNVVAASGRFGEIIGYENHSGRTYLGADTEPLATIIKGVGNNDKDRYEGAMHKNAIGTYLHGPVLSKNPKMADFLLATAWELKYKEKLNLTKLDIDKTVEQARRIAKSRP